MGKPTTAANLWPRTFAGGLAPLIMAALPTVTGGSRPVSRYKSATAAVAFAAVASTHERLRRATATAQLRHGRGPVPDLDSLA
jgi:hypothetical protein